MATYLLTWNPDKRDRQDRKDRTDLRTCVARIEAEGYCEDRWSCGSNGRIRKEDRLFLMRLGREPKGIVGSAVAVSGVYEDRHWDVGKGYARYIDLRFDALLDSEQEAPLSLSELKSLSPKTNWTPQMSGTTIEDEVASRLAAEWTLFLRRRAVRPPEEVGGSSVLYEGATREIAVNAYERNAEARERCIACYGYTCAACGFDFESKYGDVGKDFIHVHHCVPLSEVGEEYTVDPIRDLRPVCPNCHAIIHRRRPAYSIAEVKKLLSE